MCTDTANLTKGRLKFMKLSMMRCKSSMGASRCASVSCVVAWTETVAFWSYRAYSCQKQIMKRTICHK